MNFLSIFPVIDKLLERILPDKAKRDEAKLKLLEMQQAGEFRDLESLDSSDKNQTQVNVEEAKSESLFKSGWRPAAAWICVVGLLYAGIGRALLSWASAFLGIPVPPAIDTTELITMLFGLLGLGAYRSHDKKHGVKK